MLVSTPTEVQVTAVFVTIVGISSFDGPPMHTAISTLHSILRDALVKPAQINGLRVLSCIGGAIIIIPDGGNTEATQVFATIAPAVAGAGLAVHAGIAHGHVEWLPDADGTFNAVGVCLNVAARLANAQDNRGVLVHDSYADHVAGILRGEHWLHPRKRQAVVVPGKRQETFTCYACPPEAIQLRPDTSISPGSAPSDFVNVVLLAYDLPSFSDGDARQLASRFRSVVQEVGRMRSDGTIPPQSRCWFSPGGDGAVVALELHVNRAFPIAEMLEELLQAETSVKADGAGVRARLGLHYGPVLLYQDAEGAHRPTGLTLFDADALASDDEAKRYDSVVVSVALIGPAAHGSRANQQDKFEEIGPLPRPHGRQIRRFVRRTQPREPAPQPPPQLPQEHAASSQVVGGAPLAPPGPSRVLDLESYLKSLDSRSQSWPSWTSLERGELWIDESPLSSCEGFLRTRNVVFIVGPQGSGKTALARLVAYRRRQAGRVLKYWDFEHLGVEMPIPPTEYLAEVLAIAKREDRPATLVLENVHLAPQPAIKILALIDQPEWSAEIVVTSRTAEIATPAKSSLVIQKLRDVRVDLSTHEERRGAAILHWALGRRGLTPENQRRVLASVPWREYTQDLMVLRAALEAYDWDKYALSAWAIHGRLRDRLANLIEQFSGADDLLYIVAGLGQYDIATDLTAVVQMLDVSSEEIRRIAREGVREGILSLDDGTKVCRYWHQSLARLYGEVFDLERDQWAVRARAKFRSSS